MLRNARRAGTAAAEDLAAVEEDLDQLADTIRNESDALAVHLARASRIIGLNPARARQLLIAMGASGPVLPPSTTTRRR